MKKTVLVLVMALGLIGCQKEELPTEVVEASNLIEQMESIGLYERVSDSIESGLRVRRGQRISQIFESNSGYCFIEKDFNTDEFNLITSDSVTYSYRIRTDIGNVYQYAFRTTESVNSDLRLRVYQYDEEDEEHTILLDIEYVKTNTEFNICN